MYCVLFGTVACLDTPNYRNQWRSARHSQRFPILTSSFPTLFKAYNHTGNFGDHHGFLQLQRDIWTYTFLSLTSVSGFRGEIVPPKEIAEVSLYIL